MCEVKTNKNVKTDKNTVKRVPLVRESHHWASSLSWSNSTNDFKSLSHYDI